MRGVGGGLGGGVLSVMDDYMREMVDLKSLVTKTLEKRGVLARIRVCFVP